MHGLINRSIESFVTDTFGAETWRAVADRARLGFYSFEALLEYDPVLTDQVLDAAAQQLSMPREMVLEDLGTYLVSAAHMEPVRRLLRLSGDTYYDFLYSLDDLPDRARFAMDGLELPTLDLHEHSPNSFTLYCRYDLVGFGHVLMGLLRAMADDFGALVVLQQCGRQKGCETLEIELIELDFARGRDFELAVAE